MLGWNTFIYFGVCAIAFFIASSVTSLCGRPKVSVLLACLGSLTLASFIGAFWIEIGRPPLKTMGETRLWYSFFASLAGLFTYIRWKYRWILSFSTVLSTVFILLNILKPEIHDQSLMPALQSAWFIPHVTVYMFSYSLLGCAFLMGVAALIRSKSSGELLLAADTLVYIGTAFLTFGMLSGAIWAKDAWGHFWSWDPKETWALVTWSVYLMYMHLRIYGKGGRRLLCFLLIFAFACLQMCWWGINYLPSAQDSIHVY